jgi:hypothetical protein
VPREGSIPKIRWRKEIAKRRATRYPMAPWYAEGIIQDRGFRAEVSIFIMKSTGRVRMLSEEQKMKKRQDKRSNEECKPQISRHRKYQLSAANSSSQIQKPQNHATEV